MLVLVEVVWGGALVLVEVILVVGLCYWGWFGHLSCVSGGDSGA